MQTKKGVRITQQVFARRRKGRRAGFAGQQIAVEAGFQPLDLVADRRLRQAKRLGSAGDAAMLPDRAQGPQRVNIKASGRKVSHGRMSRDSAQRMTLVQYSGKSALSSVRNLHVFIEICHVRPAPTAVMPTGRTPARPR